MPGIKRKAEPLSAKLSNGSALKHKTNGKSVVAIENGSEGSRDEFDDDEDLMANALRAEEEEIEEDESGEDESGDENGANEDVMMLSDEDMEGGFEDVAAEEVDVAGPSTAKGHRSLYAIPSRDEMSALKNTSELYKSNIFKLKVSSQTFPCGTFS